MIPTRYWVLAGLALAIAGWNAGADHVQGKWDKAKAAQTESDRQAEAAARAKENDWQEKWKGAVNARTELEKRLDGARAAATAADDRLRRAADDLQRRLAAAPVETCRTAAGTAAALLGECSREYRTLAAAADGHLADLEQCEAAWPR